jgi:hypothetical protein
MRPVEEFERMILYVCEPILIEILGKAVDLEALDTVYGWQDTN